MLEFCISHSLIIPTTVKPSFQSLSLQKVCHTQSKFEAPAGVIATTEVNDIHAVSVDKSNIAVWYEDCTRRTKYALTDYSEHHKRSVNTRIYSVLTS